MTTEQFNIYINHVRGRMLRYAVAILRSKVEAEDVVSQVTERLWRDRDKIATESNNTSLAMTSVRNGCYDHFRYRQRHKHEEPEQQRALQSESIHEKRDTIELVRFAMSQLPDRQREVLHLKDIEGYSTHEIAEIFSLEETNIRMILSRARGALKEIIIKNMQ